MVAALEARAPGAGRARVLGADSRAVATILHGAATRRDVGRAVAGEAWKLSTDRAALRRTQGPPG